MKPHEMKMIVKIDRRLHASMKIQAFRKQIPLREWVINALATALQKEQEKKKKDDEALAAALQKEQEKEKKDEDYDVSTM